MIPAAFDYVRAESAEEAISLIGQHGDESKFLAGGHSLLPLMKLRLAQPTVLIDIGRWSRAKYSLTASRVVNQSLPNFIPSISPSRTSRRR